MARKTPLHEGGPCKDLDVMVARTVDLRRAKSVGRILALLEEKTSGLIEPISLGQIVLPIFGGPLLKRAVLERGAEIRKSGRNKRDSTVVSATKMDDVRVELETAHRFMPLTMRVADLDKPFDVDDNDHLVVRLDGDNRQYQKDGKAVLNTMCDLAGGATQAEILATNYFRPPEVIVGRVHRHALQFGEEQRWFAEDPNGFIKDQLQSSKSLVDDIDDDAHLFTNKVTFGEPVVLARPTEAEHKHLLAEAESPYPIEFEGLYAVQKNPDDTWYDEGIAS